MYSYLIISTLVISIPLFFGKVGLKWSYVLIWLTIILAPLVSIGYFYGMLLGQFISIFVIHGGINPYIKNVKSYFDE